MDWISPNIFFDFYRLKLLKPIVGLIETVTLDRQNIFEKFSFWKTNSMPEKIRNFIEGPEKNLYLSLICSLEIDRSTFRSKICA